MIDSKRKAIIFLTISFILAIVTAGVVLVQISQAQDRLGEMIEVAAVKEDVTSYTELNESLIEWVKFPRANVYSSLITDPEELEDVITVVNLESGDILTSNLVRKKLDIPANERVVWLDATEIVLIDQKVTEGDLVDVIVSREIEKNVETKRLLSNVKVVQIEKGKIEDTERVKISLPITEAEQLIHYQNFAKQIRVLRVNQVGDDVEVDEKSTPIVEEKPVEKDAGKKETVTDVEVEKSKGEKKESEKGKDE
ncbi:hypothetical protein [Saccharococcus sp. Marseille-Q5394]|uniref:hypothetical protein n=1 Tax=Saccharococcus sp. Marseille-Q5394 TaxID=2972778 RepID=UPI0021C90181|nr:hypothetical protein [Saccharococcus sp. Marseille-Q5394]